MAQTYHGRTFGTMPKCAKLGEDGTMDSVHSHEMAGAPNRIRELRELRKLTQERLADQINTTHTTIGRIETGERGLSDKWVRLISGALGVHPGELFRRLDESETEAAAREAAEIIAAMSTEDRQSWLALGRSLTNRLSARKSA